MVCIDKHSSANFHDVNITNINFQWNINFNQKILSGLAIYSAKILNETDKIVIYQI